MAQHTPVLLVAVLDALSGLEPGALVVDGTLGRGGHAQALLDAHPDVRLVGLDRDPAAVQSCADALRRYGDRAVVVHERFARWLEAVRKLDLERVDAQLLDLGVSSPQLDEAARGFSFRFDAPLDMRMDPSTGLTALELLQSAEEAEVARVLFEYGEERLSRRIARRIKQALAAGALHTTTDLAEICRRAYPRGPQRIDPATRTFQALRIAVNDELGELEQALAAIPDGLKPGGRACVISFHSLEDRLVKQRFVDWEKRQLGHSLKRKPIVADEQECEANPRARSAKLRVFVWGKPRVKKQKSWRIATGD